MVQLSSTIFDKYKEFADDFINDNFGVNCTLEYPPKELACINCIYDMKSRKSTNKYKTGGPIPFTFGVCPWCGGKGFKEDIVTETIKMRVYWDRGSWVKIGIPLNIPDGSVQSIGFLADFPKIKQAQKVILNSDQSGINVWEYSLYGEPVPHGFKRDKYIIMYWTRV